jgi:hypothetical protein
VPLAVGDALKEAADQPVLSSQLLIGWLRAHEAVETHVGSIETSFRAGVINVRIAHERAEREGSRWSGRHG